MVDELSEVYMNDMQKNLQTFKGEGQWSKAYVKTMFAEVEDGLKISSALLAAIFTKPELLERTQAEYKEIQEKIENDQVDPVQATIARLAADGLWFAEMFGFAPLDKKMRDQVFNELTKLITKGDES
ncbi:hypothetical protein [Bacillus atrophaeus]|uniref:hypothetical protein n=1 Tax=Bacillus atrophaeus TaxID=1452 RepID=UPI00032E128C|nr:hypothetical protein [Bacillus atrophaeus]AKL83180.1 transcriptional regulator [Bacillus atrophaeus UCMB-5137]MDS9998790.1 hypothetical protein [Bacillus atrophaeus]WFE14751.1 hypothetical protein P4829_03035 [Bacillus atrophaeus]